MKCEHCFLLLTDAVLIGRESVGSSREDDPRHEQVAIHVHVALVKCVVRAHAQHVRQEVVQVPTKRTAPDTGQHTHRQLTHRDTGRDYA
eukprot:1737174-Pleurochrysis_carterae.AAC.1